MPNQRKAGTSSHQFWCEDELWAAGLETAGRAGTNVSKVLRDALVAFVASNALERAPVSAPIDLFRRDPLACPACDYWPDLRGGVRVKDAAWAHLEECPGLVALARQAGII